MMTKHPTPPAIIFTSAEALIALATSELLDHLLQAGSPVLVPDLVRFELIDVIARKEPAAPAAAEVLDWIRSHALAVRVVSTETFEEFVLLRAAKPSTVFNRRGEEAASEVLGDLLEQSEHRGVLVFADGDLPISLLRPLPLTVRMMTVSDLLAAALVS